MPAFTEEQQSVLAKVEKLLRLAGSNPNEAEAASATAKAMALLADWNLDMSAVDATADGSGKRAEEKLLGGFYEYERDLWARVADLNFCFYWNQFTWVFKSQKAQKENDALKVELGEHHWRVNSHRRHNIKKVRQHRLVGRVVNIAATKAMIGYLLGAIERQVRERLCEREGTENINSQLLSRWAVSYREGMAYTIECKLWDRRQAQIDEEAERQEEARRRAEEAGAKGASVETGITLFTLRQSERDANNDFLYGEGFSARLAAQRAEQARKQAEADAAYTAWAAANPEKAAKQEAEREAAARKRSTRRVSAGPSKARDWGAWSAGKEAGEAVGLDPQTSVRKAAGLIK